MNGELGVETRTGNYVTGLETRGMVARPAGDDGRAGVVPGVTQAAWGWGLAPALGASVSEDRVARVLQDMEECAAGYSARQQTALRRDAGPAIEGYLDYKPVPFAGQETR